MPNDTNYCIKQEFLILGLPTFSVGLTAGRQACRPFRWAFPASWRVALHSNLFFGKKPQKRIIYPERSRRAIANQLELRFTSRYRDYDLRIVKLLAIFLSDSLCFSLRISVQQLFHQVTQRQKRDTQSNAK